MKRHRYYVGGKRTTRPPVGVMRKMLTKKKVCAACAGELSPGETVLRYAISSMARTQLSPLCECGRKRPKTKYFHEACQPADPFTVFGLTAAQFQSGFGGFTPPSAPSHSAPPPPKPPTKQEAAMSILRAFEAGLKVVARGSITPELEKQFKTYQGIKARGLNPGSEAEGDTALRLALIAAVKMVF